MVDHVRPVKIRKNIPGHMTYTSNIIQPQKSRKLKLMIANQLPIGFNISLICSSYFFDGDGFSSVLLGMVHHDVSEVVFQSKKYIEISTYMVLPFFWAILKEGHAEMLGAVWRNQGSTMKLPSRGFRIIAVLRSPSRTPRVGLKWSCWFFWNRLGVFHPRPHFRPHFRGLQWSFVGSGVSIWDHHHIYV